MGRGIVRSGQLDEAKQSRSVYGGRLGTNLVELGYLGLEELALQLAAYHDVSLPPVEWLEEPDPKALKLVPSTLIRKLKLLPLHLEREAIHVAMIDPSDANAVDFVETAASRPVVPYVLPEIRLLYWLEMHLQIDRHPRYVNLAARLRRTDMSLPEEGEGELSIDESVHEAEVAAPEREVAFSEPEAEPAPEAAGVAQAPELLKEWFEATATVPAEPDYAIGPPATHEAQDDAESEELLLEELFDEAAADEPAANRAPADHGPLYPAQVAEVEALLDGAGSRDDIIDNVMRLARNHCEVAALFVLRGDTVKAFRGSGGGIEDRLEGIELPTGVHSVFAHPAVTGFPFRGSPPEGGIDARLLAALGRDEIQELLVQPIQISGRVVNVLYCDNGSSAFGETSVAALGALADRAALAYERLILERKRETQA